MISDRDLDVAAEHPRGTERRLLERYRAALADLSVYAALPPAERDVIVRWAEVRRRIAARGVDNDPANLADPLIPEARLRAHVLAGERLAAGRSAKHADHAEDVLATVARLRAG